MTSVAALDIWLLLGFAAGFTLCTCIHLSLKIKQSKVADQLILGVHAAITVCEDGVGAVRMLI